MASFTLVNGSPRIEKLTKIKEFDFWSWYGVISFMPIEFADNSLYQQKIETKNQFETHTQLILWNNMVS
jgi:hypothetical protein